MNKQIFLFNWLIYGLILAIFSGVLGQETDIQKALEAMRRNSRFSQQTEPIEAPTISSQSREYRVNVGGGKFTDPRGNEWLPDQIYKSGSYGYLGISGTYQSQEPVLGTDLSEIYQSERYRLYGYRFAVPNGHYQIILHFAEIFHRKSGKRLFDIQIEGKIVEQNLDIFARAGHQKALALNFNTRELNLPILDGILDIGLVNKRDDTKLSGIEVIPLQEQSGLLKLDPADLDFGLNQQILSFTLQNLAAESIEWSLNRRANPSWIKEVLPISGMIQPGSKTKITVQVDRANPGSGIHQDSLIIEGKAFRQKIPVRMTVAGIARLKVRTPVLDFQEGQRNLACVIENGGGEPIQWSLFVNQRPAWLIRVYPAAGELKIGEVAFINLTISRRGLMHGAQQGELLLKSNAGEEKINLKFMVPRQNRILYVKKGATGTGSGDSWGNALSSIKEAIMKAGSLKPDQKVEIWVAEGIYFEQEIKVPSGIELYGGFSGDETVLAERNQIWSHPTIVDAQKRGRCFKMFHRTVIDGFIIQNGRDWNTGDGKGAAILTYEADIKIRNNLIRNNVDSWAGAIFIEGFEIQNRVNGFSPLIERNVLINNFANYCAAAIEIRASKATIRHNTIVGNTGYGLEIQTLTGPFQKVFYGDFYHNIIANNVRFVANDVWAEARKVTNYSFISKQWSLSGEFPPYNHGEGNIFGDQRGFEAGFIDEKNGNFRLRTDSPCIDAGKPSGEPDPDNSRPDLGAFPFNKTGLALQASSSSIIFTPKSSRQKILIYGYGGKTVEWQTMTDNEIFQCTPQKGQIHNEEPVELKIDIINSKLDEGNYQGYLAIMSSEQTLEIPISALVNLNQPEIILEPSEIRLKNKLRDNNPLTRQIMISNAGRGTFYWNLTNNNELTWLQTSPGSGKAGDSFQLQFTTSHLGFGEYYAEIEITSSEAINRTVRLPIHLSIEPAKFTIELEAEESRSLPNSGWKVTQNYSAPCIQAMKSSLNEPSKIMQLDYEFDVQEGVEFVYIFAEVDAKGSKTNDSFWVMVNDVDPCRWDNLATTGGGWFQQWVYQQPRDTKHMFVVIPGKNRLNLSPREQGAYINWLVITSDPDLNPRTYRFGLHHPPGGGR
ncbi:right-handed parallel beta-helix repeat-containing protein [candidate division KSB1 bacterium]|nr:right-handed parallel beta-helix repeat-containing protein [candidate division KSB1 bacterium]